MKKVLKISFYTCVPKIAIIWCVVPEMQSETEFFVVLDHFLPFYPLNNLKIKILKKWKKSSGDMIILYMHHIWQTYDVWLLRYGAQQTEFFVILDCFLTFYPPPKDPENQNFEKAKKKAWIYYHFTLVYLTLVYHTIIWCMVPEIWSAEDRIFDHFGPFFCPFTPLTI